MSPLDFVRDLLWLGQRLLSVEYAGGDVWIVKSCSWTNRKYVVTHVYELDDEAESWLKG